MWVQEMKHAVIKEYQKYLKNLFLGIQTDYQHILDMINFIEVGEVVDNPEMIANYLINK